MPVFLDDYKEMCSPMFPVDIIIPAVATPEPTIQVYGRIGWDGMLPVDNGVCSLFLELYALEWGTENTIDRSVGLLNEPHTEGGAWTFDIPIEGPPWQYRSTTKAGYLLHRADIDGVIEIASLGLDLPFTVKGDVVVMVYDVEPFADGSCAFSVEVYNRYVSAHTTFRVVVENDRHVRQREADESLAA